MSFVSNTDATSLFTKVGNMFQKRPPVWTGTHAEWDAMTSAQQAEWLYVNFTDDSGYEPVTGSPVLAVNPTASEISAFPNGTMWIETSE